MYPKTVAILAACRAHVISNHMMRRGAHVYNCARPSPIAHFREALDGRIPVRRIAPTGPCFIENGSISSLCFYFRPVALCCPTESRDLQPGSYSYVNLMDGSLIFPILYGPQVL